MLQTIICRAKGALSALLELPMLLWCLLYIRSRHPERNWSEVRTEAVHLLRHKDAERWSFMHLRQERGEDGFTSVHRVVCSRCAHTYTAQRYWPGPLVVRGHRLGGNTFDEAMAKARVCTQHS